MDCPLEPLDQGFGYAECFDCEHFKWCAEAYADIRAKQARTEEYEAQQRELVLFEGIDVGVLVYEMEEELDDFMRYYTEAREMRGETRHDAIKYADYCVRAGG